MNDETVPVVLHLTPAEIEIMAKRSNTNDANSIRYKLERVCQEMSVPPEPEPSLADLQTELANVIAAGTGYLPEDDDIIDLLSRLAARLRELERKVESAGRDAYRVATLYENDDSSIRWTSDKSYEVGNEPPNYQSATSESQSSSKLDGEGDGIDCGSRSDLLPPRSPSPLPERTYHGMDEKAVREWASAWEMQAWTCRDYMIRDACRAKVAEWDADPDLAPEIVDIEDWLTDAEAIIHQHCGSDGSSDEHNDWVNDLANSLWRTLGERLTKPKPDPDTVPVYLSREDAEWFGAFSVFIPTVAMCGRLYRACRAALEANPGGEA